MEQTFWEAHGNQVSAAITMVISVLIAVTVDRLVFGRAEAAAARVDTDVFSREARTRLRLLRRLLFVGIILIGAALALSQFAEIKRLATGILASTAVLGLVIGYAGRQVIANAVAGVVIAITQPLRIGDLVTINEQEGRVADIGLSFTSIDTGNGDLLVIPNEQLTSSGVLNNSAGSARAPTVVSVWLPPSADLDAARKAIEGGGRPRRQPRLAQRRRRGATRIQGRPRRGEVPRRPAGGPARSRPIGAAQGRIAGRIRTYLKLSSTPLPFLTR